MNDQQISVEGEDTHAYVDGTLSDERRLHVEQALERNPELADRLSDYFSLNSMFHERYDRVLNQPVPMRLQPRALRRWHEATNRPQFAGLAAALAIGVGIGVGANTGKDAIARLLSGTANTRTFSYEALDAFAREAAIAHVVYMLWATAGLPGARIPAFDDLCRSCARVGQRGTTRGAAARPENQDAAR
jgi:anti-sigma factor RsiW